jgi:hypothetical protein
MAAARPSRYVFKRSSRYVFERLSEAQKKELTEQNKRYRKKDLRCLSFAPEHSYNFKVGFAFNSFRVLSKQHSRFHLNDTLYCLIGYTIRYVGGGRMPIYLVPPIINGEYMQSAMKNALYDRLGNKDIVNMIEEHYNKQADKDNTHNFHMAETLIKADTHYHKRELIELFHQGKLKLAIGILMCVHYNITILEPEFYTHLSPFGTVSPLINQFPTCDDMMNYREMLIDKFLS